MNNKHLLTLGRVFFAVPFLIFGVNHLMMADAMASIVPGFLPYATFWVYFTGLALVAAALAILLKRYVKWACYGLAIFLLLTMFTIHFVGIMNGDMMMPMVGFLKDMGLLGGALLLSSIEN